MPQSLVKVDHPPQWVQLFNDEIDTLQFGPGFAKVGPDVTWNFGVTTGTGRDELETFFHGIDDKLDTKHRLLECWSGDDIHIVRGEADLQPSDHSGPKVTDPFLWIFYMNADDHERLERIFIVNGPVQTKSIL